MILQLPPAETQQQASTAGSGLLEFCRHGERTVLRQSIANSPLKLLNPKNHGNAAWVYMSSYGGGFLGGDVFCLDMQVHAGARALLATQASTKIYRSERLSSQTVCATVGDDALLVIAPDPVVPFASSSFSQQQTFHLNERANLVVVDWLNAGRWASGERWAFNHYESRIEVWRNKRKLTHESLRLNPSEGNIAKRMSRFNTLLCAIITGPELAEHATKVLTEVSALLLLRRGEMVVTASPVKNGGVLLRIAAVSPEIAGRALRSYLSFLCPLLGDDPWSRKW
jgi:urease accessory protein